MKSAIRIRRAVVWAIDDAQGRRVAVTSSEGAVQRDPVVLAMNKAELDQAIRVLRSLRDELPDAPPSAEASSA